MLAIDLDESAALLAAIPAVAGLVRSPDVGTAWSRPSRLAGFSVGGVAGHVVRAAGRLVPTLDAGAPAGEPATFDEWYLPNRMRGPADLDDGLARWIVDDGEALGAHGPASVAAALDDLAAALTRRLGSEPADRFVAVVRSDRPVPLRDYVASRLVEVVVHGDDLAVSAGVEPPAFAPGVLRTAVGVLVEMAAARSGPLPVIRALTRRERVEEPYDVLRVL